MKRQVFHNEAELQAYMQYRFDLAWCELMNYAHKKGIEVISDIPSYVSDDSLNAWSEPRTLAQPTWQGDWYQRTIPTICHQARCGATDDSASGSQHLRARTAMWWMDAPAPARSRSDHRAPGCFLGFHSYFSIPAGKARADGRWLAGPEQTCSRAFTAK
ncbi:MAG: 4-alpha-glucanotransferase, partial [Collinsella sp.]